MSDLRTGFGPSGMRALLLGIAVERSVHYTFFCISLTKFHVNIGDAGKSIETEPVIGSDLS